ncbi:MAG: c-type cytochrome biogenesis protein CcsB [Thermodesulfobacteriota bacterium]
MASLFQFPALVAYLLSTAGFLVFIVRRNKTAAAGATWLMAAGFGLQTAALAFQTSSLGQIPVLTLPQALGFSGWALTGGCLLLFWKFRLPVLGAFASPLATALVLIGSAQKETLAGVTPTFQSLWLTLHLGSIFSGYAFFGLAFLAGVMYLLQERQIKAKRTGALYHRLPSLNVLDALNYYCLTIGFPLMTLGLITGAALAQLALGAYWRWDPKEVWSLVVWLLYAVLLHQRLTVGWRGRRAAIMAIVGFTMLCFTFLGVSVLFSGYHTFESLKNLRSP